MFDEVLFREACMRPYFPKQDFIRHVLVRIMDDMVAARNWMMDNNLR